MELDLKPEDLKILFSEEQIQTRIKELAQEMNKFYNGEEVIAICKTSGYAFADGIYQIIKLW